MSESKVSTFLNNSSDFYGQSAKECYSNALDLLDDAKILFDKRKYARSYALSVISTEEMLKALFLKLVSAGISKIDEGFNEEGRFILNDHNAGRDALRSFSSKLLLFFEDSKLVLNAEFEKRELRLDELKLDGTDLARTLEGIEAGKETALHVGFDGNKISVPDREISFAKCRDALGHLKFSIHQFEEMIFAENEHLKRISNMIESARNKK